MKLKSKEWWFIRFAPGMALASTNEAQDTMRSYRRLIIFSIASGFTLIELLMVIAIIGLLSSVVLASLSAARSKGVGASIQKELVSARQAAEIYLQLHGNSYSATTGSCTAGMFADTATNFAAIEASISGSAGGAANIDCASSANAWSIAVKNPAGGYLCMDAKNTLKSGNGGGAYTALFGGSGQVAHLSATANTATACN